jgi:predicted dehydrogenase
MNRRTFQSLAFAAGASGLMAAEEKGGASRIKVGQIGTKHAHAAAQFAALRGCTDFEVVGIVEPDEEQRRKVAESKDYAGVPWLTEEQLLNTPRLQAVGVEMEVGDLLNRAERVVNMGLHLHLDKPAGESLPRFKQILDTASSKKRLVKMGYMFRFNPAFQHTFQAAKEGWLGKLFFIRGEMSKKLPASERAALLPYKGGSMFELGCHVIDAAVWLLGKPSRVTPYARSFPNDGFNDNMIAMLEYPDALVSIRVALMEPDGGTRRQFVVCGDHGSCEIRPLEKPAMKITLEKPHGSFKKGTQEVPITDAPRHVADWAAFAKAIRGEIEWPWTPEHDLAVQETVLLASGLPIT